MWIQFIQLCQELGLKTELVYSMSTVSKYVNVSLGGHKLKVRFSEHNPGKRCDADIFCGPAPGGKFYPTFGAVNYLIKTFNLKEPLLTRMPPEER